MQNNIDNEYYYEIDEEYQYESEPEELNIINYIKICRFCDNFKKTRSLTYYIGGLEYIKVCYFCTNDISGLRNNMVLTRIARNYKKKKIQQAKMNIMHILSNLKIGIQAGIHQHILEFVL
jgi:hypothetical protein